MVINIIIINVRILSELMLIPDLLWRGSKIMPFLELIIQSQKLFLRPALAASKEMNILA